MSGREGRVDTRAASSHPVSCVCVCVSFLSVFYYKCVEHACPCVALGRRGGGSDAGFNRVSP